MAFTLIFFVLFVGSFKVQTEDILMLLPFASKSHKNVFSPLASALGNKGHHVTVVSMFKPSSQVENVKELWTSEYDEFYKIQTKLIVEWGKNIFRTRELLLDYLRIQNQMSTMFYKSAQVQSWLKEAKLLENKSKGKKFPVVFLDAAMNEQIMALGNLLGDSIILVNPATMYPWISNPLGIPSPPSFVPYKTFESTSEMNFLERTRNFITSLAFEIILRFITQPLIDGNVAKHLPNAKKVVDIIKDSALVLVNADPVLDEPRPGMPNVINVGGIHCRKAKSLPKELNDFIGNSKFIVFSLGSIYDENLMTKHDEEVFIKSFSQLPYKVIWKFNRKITEKIPANVKILKWLPQQDLLGHSQSCAFITHSGLLSMQEAIYHGVPTVSIPLFGDQPGNAALAKRHNVTKILYIGKLTSYDIVNATITACENPIILESVKKYSMLFKDRPNDPLNVALFWTEYIIRHPRAMHLRNSAMNIYFFQYFLLDIIVFFLCIIFTIKLVFKEIFRLILKLR